jgi:hypothetical protein
MTNPGGEHLGTRYEPVKAVYTAMLIGWMVLFASLFIHIVTNLKVREPDLHPLSDWETGLLIVGSSAGVDFSSCQSRLFSLPRSV